MKVKLEDKQEFKPLSFTITLETQDEVDRWASAFNHSKVIGFLCDSDEELHDLLYRSCDAVKYYKRNLTHLFEQ